MQPLPTRPHVPPRHNIPAATVTTHSSEIIPPVPKPRTRGTSPSSHVEASSKPAITAAGVRVLPPITQSLSNPSPPQLPTYSGVPVAVTATPVLPSYEAAVSTHPPPKQQVATATSTKQYTLPDPTGSLSPKELETVSQITSMGFPHARAARATKRLKDSAKVRITFNVVLSSINVAVGFGFLGNSL